MLTCAQGQTREAQTLPTQVSFAVIRNPSAHLTRQRYEPAVLTHSSPDGHEAVPRLHSSTSGRKDLEILSLRGYAWMCEVITSIII